MALLRLPVIDSPMGLIMRKTGFALAVLSTIAMTVVPVAPSFAAAKQQQPTASQVLADHAKRGDVIVLSPTQMDQLATSSPALHAKLAAAHQAGKVPALTKAEKRIVNALTQQNMADIKAGMDPATTWIIIAASVLLLVFLWQPVVCQIFPWAIGCAPARAAVRVRG
jgi:hypothetical protein